MQQAADASQGSSFFENLKASLPPDKGKLLDSLYAQLSSNKIGANTFLERARGILGPQQFQLLQSLNERAGATASSVLAYNTGVKRSANTSNPTTPTTTQSMSKKFKAEPGQANSVFISNMGAPTPPILNTPGGGGFKIPVTPGAGGKSSQSTPGADNRVDFDTITDVMGYAGVDLKEESDMILQDTESSAAAYQDGVDRSKIQNFVNMNNLAKRLEPILKKFGIDKITDDASNLLAISLQHRLRNLLEQMIMAEKHRTRSQFFDPPPAAEEAGYPAYKIVIQSDIKKQLLAIERAEREQERIRREQLAERAAAAAEGEDGEGKPKKKKDKPMGPGVTARNMSEDVRKKETNHTALMIAGGYRKSWMLSGGGEDVSVKSPSSPTTSTTAGAGRGASKAGETRGKRGGGKGGRGRGALSTPGLFLPPSTLGAPKMGDPTRGKITARDAMFAIERDRGSGGGLGTSERVLLKAYANHLK